MFPITRIPASAVAVAVAVAASSELETGDYYVLFDSFKFLDEMTSVACVAFLRACAAF